MQPEQEESIYKHFPDLVQKCNLKLIAEELALHDNAVKEAINQIKFENNKFHNNRSILFALLKLKSSTIFPELVQAIRRNDSHGLANQLENKSPNLSKYHRTCCWKPPDTAIESLPDNVAVNQGEQLKIEVTYSKEFLDESGDCYRTRSMNRGRVLIINNINFLDDNGVVSEKYLKRNGAEVDEDNLKVLFEKIGCQVELYRDLTAQAMRETTIDFSRGDQQSSPDICFFILMSHGEKVNNRTVIIGSDSEGIEESWFKDQFSNRDSLFFKNKPKVLIFHVCRGNMVDNLVQQHTETDSACRKSPDDNRLYSDMIVCHPSVEGFQAHRDTRKGSWYMELICEIFMERAHDTHLEKMLKDVNDGLKLRISEKWTQQTSTYEDIAFKTCYLHPGIYEQDGELKKFKQST